MEKAFYEGKRLLNVSELCNYIGMGKSRGVEWAKGIGAAKRIGRRVLLIDISLIKLSKNVTFTPVMGRRKET